MEKIYKLNAYGEEHNIILGKTSYRNNGTLAVCMIEVLDDGSEEDWSTLTVNINDSSVDANPVNLAYVDTNNNGNRILIWLRENNIATVTGAIGFSGYCCYPLVKFTDEALMSMRSL